jgi:Xaa-Pro aminopeptidase
MLTSYPVSVLVPETAEPTRALLPFVPQLSLEERDRRWDRLRKKMLMANLDALVFLGNDIFWGMGMANMRYVFHVDSHLGAEGLFPLDGEPTVWTGPPHTNRPTSMYHSVQEWITDIRDRGGVRAVAAELEARGLQGSRIGLVAFSSTLQTPAFLHADITGLEQLLPKASLVDVSWILQEMRTVKSQEEIEMLRAGGSIARAVLDTMVASAVPGVLEAELYADMIRTQIAKGGEPNVFNLLTSGPVEHPADELWHLLHGCEQPLTPTMRPLALGDIVLSEWHTKYCGLRCHTEFTVYIGEKAPAELQNIWDVSVACLEASERALTPGRTLREAVQMIREPAVEAGLDWVELGFHSMSTGSPEFPTVVYREGYGANALNGHQIGDLVLEEGMTFGNNIDLHDPNWKVDVGCMLADFMVVRPGRAECLVGTPRELPQVG